MPPSHAFTAGRWLVALALPLIVTAALFGGTLGRWGSAGAAIVLAPALLGLLKPPLGALTRIWPARARLGPYLPHLVLIVTLGILLWELALGRPPASRDHGIHYFQTHILAHEMIPAGTMRGWSEALNSGYAFGDNYPLLGYLWTAAAHLVSFGAIPLRASYALGLLGIWLLCVWGIWTIASQIAGQITGQIEEQSSGGRPWALGSPATWAGCIASILWLLDPGASRQGGWNYLMFHGVWPQQLSTALWIASLPLTYRALHRPSPRRLALAALCLGGSILAHPFALLTVTCSTAAWPLILWATGSLRRLPSGALRWLLLIHVVGIMISLGWVVGFLADADALARSPVPWQPLGALATGLISGEIFEQQGTWVAPLACLGVLVVVWRGRVLGWLSLTLLAGMLVLGSEAAITVIRLDLLVSAFKNLQFPRYAIAIKPIWYALAGVGGAVVLTALRRALPQASSTGEDDGVGQRTRMIGARAIRIRVIAALCFAPLLVGAGGDLDRLWARPVGGVLTLRGSIHAAPEAALRRTLIAEAEAIGDRPLVVAFLRQGMGGGTYPLLSIADAGGRVVLDGHVPAVNYPYQVRHRTPEGLGKLGVTHVIWDRPFRDRDARLAKLLEEISPIGDDADFGPYHLARLGAQDSAPALARISGGGAGAKLEIVERTRGHLRLSLSGLHGSRAARIVIAIGSHRKWTARDAEGAKLEVRAMKQRGGIPGMSITLPPGAPTQEITLDYDSLSDDGSSAVETWTTWGGLAIALICLVACAFGTALGLVERLRAPIVKKISWAMGLAALALLVAIGTKQQASQLSLTWMSVVEDLGVYSKKKPPPTLRSDLVMEGRWSVHSSNPQRCDGMLSKSAQSGCSDADTRPRVGMVYRAPFLYRCLRVEIPSHGRLEIQFDDVGPGAAVGFVARMTRGHRKAKGLTVRTPGRDRDVIVKSKHRDPFRVPAGTSQGPLVVEFNNTQGWPEQVCVAAALLRDPPPG